MANLEETSNSRNLGNQLKKKNGNPRSLFGIIMTGLAGACIVITLIPLFAVLTYVLAQGFSHLNLDLLTKLPPPPGLQGGGVANAIIGTLIVVGLATVMAVPIGVMAAIYLSEFSNNNKIASWVRFATNILSGVPSIISGVFVFGLLIGSGLIGFSAIAGGFALSVIMLPIVSLTTEEALKLVPVPYRLGSSALGGTKFQTTFKIILPAALSGITTGVLLAVARAAGETAPLMFTALFSQFWQEGLMSPTPSLPVLIYQYASSPFPEQNAIAWTASLVLLLLVLVISLLSRLFTRNRLQAR
jgi:phosphate transport system permease protein